MRTLRKRSEAALPPSAVPTQPAPPEEAPAPAPLRKRSEVTQQVERGYGRPSDDAFPFDAYPLNDLFCPKCGTPQRVSSGGAVCVQGHGGLEGVTREQFNAAASTATPPLRKRSEATEVRAPEPPAGTPLTAEERAANGYPPLPEAWQPPLKPQEPMFARATESGLEDQQWESLAEQVHDVGDPKVKAGLLLRAMSEQAEQTWRANPLHRADLATQAKALHISAKLLAKRKELDRAAVERTAREEARSQLKESWEKGQGAITIEQVSARFEENHPDEYRRIELDKVRDKGLVEYLEQLASNFAQTIRGGGTG